MILIPSNTTKSFSIFNKITLLRMRANGPLEHSKKLKFLSLSIQGTLLIQTQLKEFGYL